MRGLANVPRADRGRLAALAAVVALGAAASIAVPFLWDSPYWISVGANIATFAIFGISYNILLGSAGVFSFGHALFFGLSGYVIANLMLRTDLNFFVGATFAIAATALLSALVGVLTARLSGITLSIVTLAVAEAFFMGAGQDIGGLTRGEDGLYLERIPEFLNINLHADNVYWLALGVLALVLVVTALLRSRLHQKLSQYGVHYGGSAEPGCWRTACAGDRERARRESVRGHQLSLTHRSGREIVARRAQIQEAPRERKAEARALLPPALVDRQHHRRTRINGRLGDRRKEGDRARRRRGRRRG